MRFGKSKSGPAWVHVRGGFHLADFPQNLNRGTCAKVHMLEAARLTET
jgi:hypothetical protein